MPKAVGRGDSVTQRVRVRVLTCLAIPRRDRGVDRWFEVSRQGSLVTLTDSFEYMHTCKYIHTTYKHAYVQACTLYMHVHCTLHMCDAHISNIDAHISYIRTISYISTHFLHTHTHFTHTYMFMLLLLHACTLYTAHV
jgi:hypothetical protein